MPGSGNTTVESPDDETSSRPSAPRFVPALVLCWTPVEPDRVGEVALVDGERSSEWILGRDLLPHDDPAAPIRFVQQRPGINRYGGPLGGEYLSRRQLHIRVTDAGLDITNIGTAVLLINGHEVAKGAPHSITPGAVLTLRAHSVYRFMIRPTLLPVLARPRDLHPFGHPDADGIVGESPAAWASRADVDAAVLTQKPTLILGPTGTGKELTARAIHRLSGRRGRFVACNAANVTQSLTELILFGNLLNYPNPGTPASLGVFGEAEGGTLFLDEIGELPLEMQARILRALEGKYTRLGESRERGHDVLIVAATNRDPSALKHDVLPRFGARVRVPSLTERVEDLPLLARALIVADHEEQPLHSGRFVHPHEPGEYPHVDVTSKLIVAMLRATYPGNVRDLGIFLDRAIADTESGSLLPPSEMSTWHVSPTMPPPGKDGLADAPKRETRREPSRLTEPVVRKALGESAWNVAAAARLLGVSRDALIRRMEESR